MSVRRGDNIRQSYQSSDGGQAPGGRRIFNQGPTQSKFYEGHSARPGDQPRFDQNFGSETFARSNTGVDALLRNNQASGRLPRRQDSATSSALKGGIGKDLDTRGDRLHNMIGLAKKDANIAMRESQEGQRQGTFGGGAAANLNKTGPNQRSGHSIIHSSGEYQPSRTGFPPSKRVHGPGDTLEESVAAMDRPPKIVEGLFEFLRKEYYRRMGIYLNGGENDKSLLMDFWKDNVSEAYKALRQKEQADAKLQRTMQKHEELRILELENPNAYNKIMAEKYAKELAQEDQMLRNAKIQSKQTNQCKYHARPVATCNTCQRVQSQMGSQYQPGATAQTTPAKARRVQSAVPGARPKVYSDYEKFGKQFEADVVYTIGTQCDELFQQDKQEEVQYQQRMQKAMDAQEEKYQDQVIDNMLQLYFLLPHKPADPKDSPSKQAALPPKPGAPLRPVEPVVPPQQAVEKVPVKDLMKGPRKHPELKDNLKQFPEEVVAKYLFFLELFRKVRKADKRMSNNTAKVQSIYREQKTNFAQAMDERTAGQLIAEFFHKDSFIRRLSLHRDLVCKSKTKKQTQLDLYYIEIPKRERQLNLIDFDEPGQDAKDLIKKDIWEKRMAAEEKERKKEEARLKKKEEEKRKKEEGEKQQQMRSGGGPILTEAQKRKKRIEQLAKPNDKWKVGKKLMEFQKEFPHDRVLQRMVKQEFQSNQTFRYPDEYDKYDQTEEKKMKHAKLEDQGLKKHDYDQGLMKLETFKIRDKLENEKTEQKQIITRQAYIAFEEDLIVEAQAYTVEASKRLNQASGERKTYRKSLAEIYWKMQEKHQAVVKQKFQLKTYGMDRPDEEKFRKKYLKELQHNKEKMGEANQNDPRRNQNDLGMNREDDRANEQKVKKAYEEAVKAYEEKLKKAYPENFKRAFFRLIKTLNGKAPGKMSVDQTKKNVRRLPTTFMVAGTSKRCTIHQVSCPEEPCPYRTHNKKIVMTHNLARKRVNMTTETRSRVFYRKDFKPKMSKIFMSNDDQLNCRFEPCAGSLNPQFWHHGLGPMPERLKHTAETEKDFQDKHGDNFSKTHPEVYKKGVLKKAQAFYRAGEFRMAMNKLMDAFKLDSLRREYDPKYHEKKRKAEQNRQLEAKIQADRKAEEKKELGGIIQSKSKAEEMKELEAANARSKPKKEEGGLFELESLKEDPDKLQEKMPGEDFENLKLVPILKEAYELVVAIENQERQVKKEIKKLEQQKEKLKQKENKLQTLSSIEDQAANVKELFKTIMCPLNTDCPNDTRQRWPQSSLKTTTQFGSSCPYAHHGMELQFPQTIKTKVKAIGKMQSSLQTQIDSKKPGKAFIPTGSIKDCSGGCFAVYKCNMCKYKQMAGTLITEIDTPLPGAKANQKMKSKCYRTMQNAESKQTLDYLKEIGSLKEQLNLDDMYCKKFGLLKKASILAFYGHDKDAKKTIAEAAVIVQQQRRVDEEKFEAIQQRWKFKLGLDDVELGDNINLKKMHPKDIKNEDLAKVDMGSGVTVSTLRLFIEKVSPFNHEAYSKNVFLDRCIEEMYLSCEGKKMKKHGEIERMKKHIEGLEEIAELADQFGEEGVEENLMEDEGEGVKFKPRKTKMCQDMLTKGKCKNGTACKFAHNPLQLELIDVSKKIKNLKGVVVQQSRMLHQNQPIQAFIPSNNHIEVDRTCFEPYVDTKVDQTEGDEGEDKPKSIFEREDLFKDPLEEKD